MQTRQAPSPIPPTIKVDLPLQSRVGALFFLVANPKKETGMHVFRLAAARRLMGDSERCRREPAFVALVIRSLEVWLAAGLEEPQISGRDSDAHSEAVCGWEAAIFKWRERVLAVKGER